MLVKVGARTAMMEATVSFLCLSGVQVQRHIRLPTNTESCYVAVLCSPCRQCSLSCASLTSLAVLMQRTLWLALSDYSTIRIEDCNHSVKHERRALKLSWSTAKALKDGQVVSGGSARFLWMALRPSRAFPGLLHSPKRLPPVKCFVFVSSSGV